MKFKKIVSIGITQDALDKKYWDALDVLAENRVLLTQDSKEIPRQLADADCLLVWFNGVDQEIIDSAPNLKYIGALATGVGKIDVAYAKKKGITVTNIPGYSTEAVAELVFAVLLEYLRQISRGKVESEKSRTSETGFRGREIKGKDFGVVGLGRIGSRVAELAAAFGAEVYYWGRGPKKDNDTHSFEGIDTLIGHCDFISINLELNQETERVFNADRVARIKTGAIVINTAPLELFDLDALDARLAKNDLVFIFDHTDPGDISDNDLKRLNQHKNCITYPVLGYITDEAKEALQEIFLTNIKSMLEGKVQNKVY